MRPSRVAAATKSLPLKGKTTGEEENSEPAEYVCFTSSVLGSSAASTPPLVVTSRVPSGPNAGPAEPATVPAGGCQLRTFRDPRSIAQIPRAASLQPCAAA